MNPDALLAAAALLFAVAFFGVVAWALWFTWLYVHRSEPLPPEWVNDGHRPPKRPECWRPRGDWRSRCDAS